jgi:Leucyl-tRNA synthetase
VVDANWPVVDESALIQDNIQIIAQVNGKLRAKMMIPLNSDNQKVQELAFADEGVRKNIEGKEIIKVIVVPNKLINVVVR